MRERIPKEYLSDQTPDKERIEGILSEWLGANPDIDWVYKDNHAKDIEALIGGNVKVSPSPMKVGEFHIVCMDENQKYMGSCEMDCQTETFQWLQC